MNCSAGPRDGCHLNALFDAKLNKIRTWIGNARSSRIRDQANLLACLQVFQNRFGLGGLIEFMLALERFLNFIVMQKNAAMAGVFAKNVIASLESFNCPKRHIG